MALPPCWTSPFRHEELILAEIDKCNIHTSDKLARWLGAEINVNEADQNLESSRLPQKIPSAASCMSTRLVRLLSFPLW